MKTKLNAIDRLVIPRLLPEKTGIMDGIIKKEIIEIVGIKSEEFGEYDFKEEEGGRLTWDPKKVAVEKEFELSNAQIKLLQQAVDIRNKGEDIIMMELDTCLKIQKLELKESKGDG